MANLGMTLADYKAWAIKEIDSGAEQFRWRFITPGAGQAVAYMSKLAEAKLFTTHKNTPVSDLPHLSLESVADGTTMAVKAAAIIAADRSWQLISAKIDATRLTKKRAINTAPNAIEVRRILDFKWESIL